MESIFPSISAILSISGLGLAFGIILSIAKIKLKVDKDPRILKISDALPGANCGACGLPGCNAYAQKIVENDMDISLCPVGGSETIAEIAEIMGKEAVAGVATIAKVHCQGTISVTKQKFEYDGPLSCKASQGIMGGDKMCSYGCLGYGDCVAVCPFDAIIMSPEGLPVVNIEACTGCGNCVTACPRDIISLVPENFDVLVMCKNREKTPIMKKGCTVGCIGCQLCVKACKKVFEDNPNIESAVTVDSFCASINYDICTNCYSCVEVCPVPVIHPIVKSNKYKKEQEKALAAK